MLVRVNIQTDLLKDTVVVPLRQNKSKNYTKKWFLDQVHQRYSDWHPFKVYEFEFQNENFAKAGNTTDDLLSIFGIPHEKFGIDKHEISVYVKESIASIEQRRLDEIREKEERLRREAEARRVKIEREKRIVHLKSLGHCWELEGYNDSFLDVPLNEGNDGMIVMNKGSLDQWSPIRYVSPILPSWKKWYFSVLIEALPETTNTWKICVGCVPMTFNPKNDRHWVGAQHSWSYIAGTGGKCHNSGKSIPYGEKYDAGDIIGVLLDFTGQTIEFFKNGVSQGVAFSDLEGPVYPAVSLTAKDCRIRLLKCCENIPNGKEYDGLGEIMLKNIQQHKKMRHEWNLITSKECFSIQTYLFNEFNINNFDCKFSQLKDEAFCYLLDDMKYSHNNSNDHKNSKNNDDHNHIIPKDLHLKLESAIQEHNRENSCSEGNEGDNINSEQVQVEEENIAENKNESKIDNENKEEKDEINSDKNDDENNDDKLDKHQNKKLFWSKVRSISHVHNYLSTKMINIGCNNKWRLSRTIGIFEKGLSAFEVLIVDDAPSTNTWRICVGCIPLSFQSTDERCWVGARQSWAYIAGTGGKCFNSAQSTAYGEKYSTNDIISILMDFDNNTLEFFKNGISQGIAFDGAFYGPVHGAISMTGTNSIVQLRSCSNKYAKQLQLDGIDQRKQFDNIMDTYGNVWDMNKQSKTKIIRKSSHGSSNSSVVYNNSFEIIDNCIAININPNDDNKWKCIASKLPYQNGRRYFEIEIMETTNTKNSWQICVGVIPKEYDFKHKKLWIGAQNSWAYISGTGGKVYNSSKSLTFGSKYQEKDKIGVLMDFDNHTLEFFKNDVPQGEAFNNLYGPVYAAVSMTGNGTKVKLDANVEHDKMDSLFLFH